MYRQSAKNTSTDVVLPVLKDVAKLTQNKKLTGRNLFRDYYNCWGFTAFTFKWIDNVEWFGEEEMEYSLECFTTRVRKPKEGDIIVYRKKRSGELMHTAIFTDVKSNKIIHKPGGMPLEVNTVDSSLDLYGHNLKVSYRRAVPDKKFKYKDFDSWSPLTKLKQLILDNRMGI